jgi:K+-transporting ATPase ATPase C chain
MLKVSALARTHWAALRALLVLTLFTGIAYPLLVWAVAQVPGLEHKADGSIVTIDAKAVGSSLIGQSFTDTDGSPLPAYFQSRPSMAGDGYDPLATSASNLGPENILDAPDKPSLLTQVCTRSLDVAKLDGVDGARPFCTGDGVGAVLSVIGPRDAAGQVMHPTEVISVNQPCSTTKTPFLVSYNGAIVQCAKDGEDYSAGQLVPIRGAASGEPVVPADAVTASGSGLDPDISPAYAELQINRVAGARGVSPDEIRDILAAHTGGRTLGFMGEPHVNVLELNLALDKAYRAR